LEEAAYAVSEAVSPEEVEVSMIGLNLARRRLYSYLGSLEASKPSLKRTQIWRF
jgi:hypothetical protein